MATIAEELLRKHRPELTAEGTVAGGLLESTAAGRALERRRRREAALEPRKPEGALDWVTRMLLVGEAATAGGVREAGLLRETPELGAAVVPKAALTRPREFGRGALRGIKAGYDWTQATREIAPPGTPEWETAAAGLTRGIAYDPLSYVGVGLAGKALRRGAEAVGVTKLPAVQRVAKFRKRLGEVGEVEREARRLREAESLPTIELARRVEAQEARVTGLQRSAEEAMSGVYRREGRAGALEVQELVRTARLAGRASRRFAARARVAEAQAGRFGKRARPPKGKAAKLAAEARAAGKTAEEIGGAIERPENVRAAVAQLREVLEEMAAGAREGGPVEVLRLAGKGAARSWRRVGRTVGYDLAQVEHLAVRAGYSADREGLEAFAKRLYGLASEGGVAESRFRFPGKIVRDFGEADMRFTGTEARAALRGLRSYVARAVEESKAATRGARAAWREKGRLEKAAVALTPAQKTYGRLASQRLKEAARFKREAAEAFMLGDDVIIELERKIGPVSADVIAQAKKTPGDWMKLARQAAEREAIPEAQAAAQKAMDAGLVALTKSAGREVADEVAGIIGDIQARSGAMTQRAIEAGYLTEQGAKKWGSFYVWRGFERHLNRRQLIERLKLTDPDLAAKVEAEFERIRLARKTFGVEGGIPEALRHRRELLGREVLEALGELPVSQRLLLGEWRAGKGAAEAYRMGAFARKWGLTAEEFRKLPAREKGHWTEVAQTERMGELAQRPWVPRWLAAHLGLQAKGGGWEKRIADWHSWLLPAQGRELQGAAYDAVSLWKWAHTAGNLPTQVRNSITNALMTYLVGKMPLHEIPGYLARALRSVVRRDEAFRGALAVHPGFAATLSRAELGVMRDALREAPTWGAGIGGIAGRLLEGGRGVLHAGGRLYEVSEQSAKMAVYLYHVEHGMAAKKAANLAMKAIFDYGDVNRVMNWLRRTGVAPFVTFPIRATQALVPAMLEGPGRFATLTKTLRAPGYAAGAEQIPAEQAAMPEWAKGKLMRLPAKTAEGDTLYLDVGYLLPWGPWAEGLGLDPLDLAPLVMIPLDIRRNESSFTRRRIYEPELPLGDKLLAIADWVGEQLGPGFVMRGLPRIKEAVEGRKRYRWAAPAETPSVGRTVAGELLGIRTRALRPDREMRLHLMRTRGRLRELAGIIRSAYREEKAGEITAAERERRVTTARGQIKQLRGEYGERRGRYLEALPAER